MNQSTRRNWLKGTAAIGAGLWLGGQEASARPISPNEKLNLAFIGVGGRGEANVNGLKNQNMVAFCDVDGVRAKKSYERFSTVERFVDYRKMLDKIENKIDGVVISTPDHTHFHPSYQALQMGKHVYLEKPMAHNVWEIRTLCNLAREKKVATQLGVQRHTLENMHRVVELIQAGAIGRVKEVYCWIGGERGMPGRPKNLPPVPKTLDYDLWLGPAAKSPYHPSITPYGWRFWWDYGTGETGNWGCHILDIPYWALGLKHATRVSGKGPKVDQKMTPKSMQTTLEFAESSLGDKTNGPVNLHWSHQKSGPSILKEKGLSASGNNTLFIGAEGMLLCGFGKRKLYPEEKFADFKVEQTIEKSPGFYKEWVTACQGGEPATCNFEYSGPMAESVILANVAYRAQTSFDWNSSELTTGEKTSQSLIRESYRKGWEISEAVHSKNKS